MFLPIVYCLCNRFCFFFLVQLQELLFRSNAETQKLEMLSEMSSLKLRYAALERENVELRGQLKRSEQDMISLVSQVIERIAFVSDSSVIFVVALVKK